MSSCALCHSSLPDESASCPFCGGSAAAHPKTRSEKQVRKTLEEARSAILDKPKGLDFKRARAVLEAGFQALEEGKLEEASRAVHALEGALARVGRAEEVLPDLAETKEAVAQGAKAGLDVAEARDELEALEERAEEGKVKGVKKALKAVRQAADPSALVRQAKKNVAAARKRINYARERGGSVDQAQKTLATAEEALEEGDVPQAEELVERAARMAEYARKNAYAQRLIDGARKHIDKAKDRGADVQEAQDHLQHAQKALKSGVYADVQKWTKATREAAERARRRRIAEDNIQRVEKLLEQEAKEGSDLTETKPHLEEAWRAHHEERFSDVTKALARCRRAAEQAARVRKAKESLELLRVEMAEVRTMQGDTAEAEAAWNEAKEALTKRDWRAFRGKYQRANRTATKARKDREREIVLTTVEKVVQRAGEGGVSALGARELLVEVEKALAQGRASDIDNLVEAKFEAEAARKESEILRGIADLRSLLAEMRVAGLEVSGASKFLDQAEEALEAQDLGQAEELLPRAREAVQSLEEALQASARRSVEELEAEVPRLRDRGVSVPEAEEFLSRAQGALEEGHASQALDLARMGLGACRGARGEEAPPEVSPERRIELERRLSKLRALMKDLDRAEISIEGSEEELEQAEHALTTGQLEAAEASLSSLEEVADLLSNGLEVAAQDRLSQAGNVVHAAVEEGLVVERGNQVLSTAHEALEDGRFVEVLEYCKVIEDIVDGVRQKSVVGDVDAYVETIRRDLAALEAKGFPLPKMGEGLADVQEAASRGEIEKARLMAQGLGEALEDFKSVVGAGDVAREAEDVTARIEEAREALVQAHEAIAEGDPEALRPLLATAILRLGEGSQGLETFIGDVQRQLDLAESLGAPVSEARSALSAAEAAGGAPGDALQSLEEARRLVSESVRTLGEDAEADLVLEMPEEGLAEGEWTRHHFFLVNRGKVPARQVRVHLHGEVDVRGLETVAEVAPGERRRVGVDLRPQTAGRTSLGASIAYRRYFDGAEVQRSQEVPIRPSAPGTYLVEDAFLVHGDGRLICHESRRTMDEIDEDIFSGMLTVVQDFVKDSFRQRTQAGLRRLEFAESKIIIERGPRVYLAAVLLGDEPDLLPLYMTEVINEIEREYGERLEKWTGMLGDVEGVEALVRKLLYYTDEEVIQGPEGTETAVASAMRLIRGGKAMGLDLAESEELLAEAKEAVSEDADRAWGLIQDAVEKALKSQQELQGRLDKALKLLEEELDDLAGVGLENLAEARGRYDASRDEVEKAKRALARGEFDAVARLVGTVEESVSVLKERVVADRVEVSMARAEALLDDLEAEGADVEAARDQLEHARTALAEGKLGRVHRHLEEAEALTQELRKSFMLEKRKGQLQAVEALASEMAILAGGEDLEHLLAAAKDAAEARDVDELELLLDRAREVVMAPDAPGAEGKDARLLLRTPTDPLQAGVWNRYVVEVTNRGNWSAESVEVVLGGEVEVRGETSIDRLDPGETRSLELGVRPREGGDGTVEVEVSYRRLLEDRGQVMRDVRDLAVAPESRYPVSDALLYLPTGESILHVTRRFRDKEEQAAFDAGLAGVQAFLREETEGPKPFTRVEATGGRALVLPGGVACLVALPRDAEPSLLPLYMMEVLREVEQQHAKDLRDWKGDPEVQARVRRIVQKLLLASDVEGADLGPLTASLVTAHFVYGTPAAQRAQRAQATVESVTGAMEQEGLPAAFRTLEEALGKEIAPAPTPPRRPGVEGVSVEVDDITLKEYIDIVKEVDRAVSKARGKAGLEVLWPIPRLAIRAANPEVAAAAASFKAMILSHANAKEADILQKGEFWKGADLKMQIDEEALSRSYESWAKRIGLILRSRDPWKVKEGIDRGGYQMGIEGQSITIAPSMVHFQVIIPDHVVVQQFPGGMVFLDTTLTEDTEAEGYANEIIRIVLEGRKEMEVDDATSILVKLVMTPRLKGLLGRLKEYLRQEVNAEEVYFVEDTGDTEYVVEAEIRDETFSVALEPA